MLFEPRQGKSNRLVLLRNKGRRRNTHCFFEQPAEIINITVADNIGYLRNVMLAALQKRTGSVHTYSYNKLFCAYAGFVFEQAVKVRPAYICHIGKFFN